MWLTSYSVIKLILIGQVVIEPDEFQDAIERAEMAANEITTQWQNQWGCMLGRFCEDNFFLYRILTGFGIIAAVVTLILLILKIAKDLNDDNYTDAVPQLIWPFIVTLLLTPSFILLPNFSIADEINLPGQPPLTIDVPFAVEFPYNPLARYTIEFQRIVRAIDNAILFSEGVAGPDTNIVTLQRQAQAMTSAPATIQNFLNQCRGEEGQPPPDMRH